MFGFGNDSEQKLDQNMEQIKNMVEDGDQKEQAPAEEENSDQWSQLNDNSNQNSGEEKQLEDELNSFEENLQEKQGDASWDQAHQEARQETQEWHETAGKVRSTGQETVGPEMEEDSSNVDTPPVVGEEHDSPDQPPAPEGNNQQVENRSPPSIGTDQNQEEDSTRQEPDSTSGRTSRERGNSLTGLDDSIPEPAKTKQLNVPEVDKGPLFIRQKKFERAAQLIRDMKYLTDRIEETVNVIEEDIQNSQRTESEIRELIDDFETGRGEVEDIVSPDDS